VILEELGDYPEHIFDSFEEEPIASASLAQVHIAREKLTGRKLAIKVQHRGLRETSKGDLLALESIVRVIDRVFDEFKWGWIVDEIAPNLPKELDFKHEGRNGERAEKHLKQSGLDCIVPKVHWDHTTERVLCMDFEHGYSVTNIEEIDLQKVNKR
jgi:aarF domain-containing kinase